MNTIKVWYQSHRLISMLAGIAGIGSFIIAAYSFDFKQTPEAETENETIIEAVDTTTTETNEKVPQEQRKDIDSAQHEFKQQHSFLNER